MKYWKYALRVFHRFDRSLGLVEKRSNAWTEEELAAYLARFNRAAIRAPDLEPNPVNELARADETKEVYPRYNIHIHSKRRRLCDADGISAKFAIDGLVAGGLLRDDGPTTIKEVTFSQEKSKIEETLIEIWELK